jgi:hypothetical protein
MPRTVPVIATEVPGNFQTAALWTAQISATMQWVFGTGSNGVPRFKGYQGSAQSIATGQTDAPITLDTEVYDSEGGHSTTVNPSRYTCQVAGVYRISVSGSIAPSGTGARKVGVNVNGAASIGAAVQQVPPASNTWQGAVSTDTYLNVGDYVELVVWQTSGGNLSTNAGTATAPTMCVWWLGNN